LIQKLDHYAGGLDRISDVTDEFKENPDHHDYGSK
jgi:hypothetical protein